MNLLIDTNVFFHTINSNIYSVAVSCKDLGNDMCITETILWELEPGYCQEEKDASSREIHTSVSNFIKKPFDVIKFVNIDEIDGARDELKKIRKRFYSWIYDTSYLNRLIQEGELTKQEIKYLKYKDLGECELLAVAITSNEHKVIISNDKGRVYKHPEQNIFETYKYSSDITILTGDEWLVKMNSEKEALEPVF